MAKSTDKIRITLDSGVSVEAQAPVIVSASRSTDIPAFYADWFFERLKRGYSAWTNPFNGVTSYVAYSNTRFIVFWSKNPRPLLEHLDYLTERDIGCYIQYTLNDYETEGLEKGVPPLSLRIETFKMLVDILGKERVVWRFDPMILTDKISIDDLVGKVRNIGDQLKNYTEKLVFSFADIASYRKVKSNLEKNGINYIEWDEASMNEFAARLSEMNKERGWNFKLATCGEKIDIEQYGIEHNHCVDDDLMIRFEYHDKELMDFLKVDVRKVQPSAPSMFEEFEDSPQIPEGAIMVASDTYAIKRKNNKDKGQRQFCGCIISKDIGQYNTCPHLCEYCYANTSKDAAVANWRRHKTNPNGDKIIGI
ncbi:DUF1848 domain-containing protein [Duncaniella freteri]|uniref:DUF1848 domain-containing protein n=5 Tax=Duncaniella TaxID=2518495 RepID=UPI001368A0CD|nr:DUF1848 domain-containing protein [Duncaniella freteri]NBJ07188.1 DUF1848 domain-containing protein [Alistipes sp. Z76]NCE69232.1 DUF1848 domain-containing protein [Muribaculaceae bacterium M3]